MKKSEIFEMATGVLFEMSVKDAPTDDAIYQVALAIDPDVLVETDPITEEQRVYVFSDWSRSVC